MTIYTCQMHPEIKQNKPGRCKKCSMNLLSEKKISTKTSKITNKKNSEDLDKTTWKNYIPLIVIIGLILLVSLVINYNDFRFGDFSIQKTISYFMIGFFIVFAGFKLIDLRGFAEGYFTYDLLAGRWFAYGYIYPFIELFFGIAMIINWQIQFVLLAEIIVMTFGGLGVINKLIKKEKFQCVCLGTALKIPLTSVTLIENFGMAILAIVLLLL